MEEKRTDVLARDEALVLFAWQDEESVSTEVVSLRLQQVGRDNLAPVAVEERQRGGESRHWYTP